MTGHVSCSSLKLFYDGAGPGFQFLAHPWLLEQFLSPIYSHIEELSDYLPFIYGQNKIVNISNDKPIYDLSLANEGNFSDQVLANLMNSGIARENSSKPNDYEYAYERFLEVKKILPLTFAQFCIICI